MDWWPCLENDPPTSDEIFCVQKYFLLIVQNNIIEFQKHKRSGHPNEITFTMVIKMINMCFDGAGGGGSVSTLTYFQKQEKVTEINANVGSSCNPLTGIIVSPNIRSWCNTLTRVIASAVAMSLVLGDSRTKVMTYTMFVQCLPLFLHTRIIPNYLN